MYGTTDGFFMNWLVRNDPLLDMVGNMLAFRGQNLTCIAWEGAEISCNKRLHREIGIACPVHGVKPNGI